MASSESSKDLIESGEWSDILQISTKDNQRINPDTVDNENISRFYHETSPIDMNSSFVSSYSITTNQGNKNQNNDSYLFQTPGFIYG